MGLSHMFFRGTVLGLVTLLAACSTYTVPGAEPVPVETAELADVYAASVASSQLPINSFFKIHN